MLVFMHEEQQRLSAVMESGRVGGGGGGGHSGTEWIPTAKRQHATEAVNDKM